MDGAGGAGLETRAHAGGEGAAGQGGEVLEERGVEAGLGVGEIAATEEKIIRREAAG